MSLYLTDEGLVLRAADYKDSDKILTVLTKKHGLLTVSARGVKRKGSRLKPASEPFSYSEMTLYEKNGRYYMNDADVKNQFFELTDSLERVSLASYICQVLSTESEGQELPQEVMRLALNTLYALSRDIFPQALLKAAFEVRYVALCGYRPDFGTCAACGEAGRQGSIDLRTGEFFCSHCAGGGQPLDEGALAACRYILSCDLKRLFSFDISPASLKLLSRFAEEYLLAKMEQGFKTLDFYKSLTFED